MKKFLTTLFIVLNLFFMSVAQAEVKTYEGVGEYLMSDFETFDIAQQRAKQRAEQNACEQAGVYVESRTEVRNTQVTKDEIMTITSGILKIVDIQYKREIIDENTTRISATVKAQIDSDDINKWLTKGAQERAILVAQNEELRRTNAEQDKKIAALKKQLADVRTNEDRNRIKQEIIDKDKKFLSIKGNRVFYSNFDEVTHAVGFMPLSLYESRYEVNALSVNQGVAEVWYGRRWEPEVSLKIRTYKRNAGEEPQNISDIAAVKWRVDTSMGTTVYIAKISETQHVAVWAIGQYTFSAQAENLSYKQFRALITDNLVPLSTHYYSTL